MRSRIRFRPSLDLLEDRKLLARRDLLPEVEQALSQLPNESAAVLLLHSLEDEPAPLYVTQQSNELLYNEIYNDSELRMFLTGIFQKVPTTESGPRTFHGVTDKFSFNDNKDLYLAFHIVKSIVYTVTKAPDGSGTITLTLKDDYDFEHAAVTWRTLQKEGLVKVVGKNLGNVAARLQQEGKIHPYKIFVPLTFTFGPDSQLLPGQQNTPTPSQSSTGVASNFPLGTYSGSYSENVEVQNNDDGSENYVQSAGTITVLILSYDDVDGQVTSGSVTIANFAGQTISIQIGGVILEPATPGSLGPVSGGGGTISFSLFTNTNPTDPSVSLAGTFQGTTMVVTTLMIYDYPGDDSDFNPNDQDSGFDLVLA